MLTADRKIVTAFMVGVGQEMTINEYRRRQREYRWLAYYEDNRFGISGYGPTEDAAVLDLKTKSGKANVDS